MTQSRRWIAYLRDRTGDPNALAHQEAVARRLVPAGADVLVVVDVGGSGLAMRPGLERVLELVRAGGVAGIASADLTRLTRSQAVLRDVRAELERHDAALVTQSGPVGILAATWSAGAAVLATRPLTQPVACRHSADRPATSGSAKKRRSQST